MSLGITCGVAASGCRWPCQPRLPRDPPCTKGYEVRTGSKCVAWRGGVKFACVEVFGRGECVCVVLVMGFVE